MQIQNEHTFLNAVRSGINLFLGAGFSILAKNSSNKPLPLGSELVSEIMSEFRISFGGTLSLSQICTIVESTKKHELRSFLENRFRVNKFDERYKLLNRFKIKAIFTTNIDDLLFKVFADSAEHYLSDLDATGPAYHDKAAINLVHLHGCINNPNRPLRFGTAELAAAFGADPDRWHFLTQGLQQNPTLFWGYSVADAGALQALSPETTAGRKLNDRWILLHPKSADEATRQYFAALGFQIAIGTTEEMLGFFGSASFETKPKTKTRVTAEIFPGATIPPIGDAPRRPVLDFFMGAPPEWSDIYSGLLHTTSHFNRVRDAINASKDVVIIGAPASGKTTLLMQLAANTPFEGHKLIFDSLTLERAKYIYARLEGEQAFIFLDNCCDSIDALQLLSQCHNVQIVGADRDYNFGFMSHKMSSSKYAVLDVTELSPADIQGCLQSIPRGIALREYRAPRRDSVAEPSLFEIIEANIAQSTLRERFKHVLEELLRSNETHHDLLLMVSYVHQCRVPASFDMLFAYLRDVTSDWKEVKKIRDEIGSMVADYFGDLVPDNQDYFVPRSILVGETIIRAVDNASLRRVIVKFHKEVSPYRICRYDVFRRHAYDADLFVRAFPEWEEGKQFYQDLYQRDGSPFMLQQAALYLSRKKQHGEAFTMIDRAIVESENRKWSIRNSHAIIMFRANIELSDKATARQSLKRSMETLTECYKWDNRRLFHAITFSDQALDYWRVFGDQDALNYLQTARSWLEEEQKTSPWSRRLKQLLPEIRQIVG